MCESYFHLQLQKKVENRIFILCFIFLKEITVWFMNDIRQFQVPKLRNKSHGEQAEWDHRHFISDSTQEVLSQRVSSQSVALKLRASTPALLPAPWTDSSAPAAALYGPWNWLVLLFLLLFLAAVAAPTMSLIKAGRCVYQRRTALAKLE